MENQPTSIDGESIQPYKCYSRLDEIILQKAYGLLSSYGFGIRRKSGDLLIRPSEVRLILSNIRISKSLIAQIVEAMEERGMLERGNQFLIVKRGGVSSG